MLWLQTSDPLLSYLPSKGNLLLDGSTLGGFPVKFLVLVVRLLTKAYILT